MSEKIWLKIIGDEVEAFGDIESLNNIGNGTYDLEMTAEEWDKCGNSAHVENGKIVLGDSKKVAYEKNSLIVRNERRFRLRQVDKINGPWWDAMSESKKKEWTDYRQALLDITEHPEFPWDGNIDHIPWPIKPTTTISEQGDKTSEEIENENWETLRKMRDEKLNKTDYLLISDYPIDEETLEKVKEYRQALRDITKLKDAPWDGGGPNTPWPKSPV